MNDTPKQETSEGNVDHGFGVIEALVVVALKARSSDGLLDNPPHGNTVKTGSSSVRGTISMTDTR